MAKLLVCVVILFALTNDKAFAHAIQGFTPCCQPTHNEAHAIMKKCTYTFHDSLLTYEEAQLNCEKSDGHLATIYSRLHQNLVLQSVQQTGTLPTFVWIGLNSIKAAQTGHWAWNSGACVKFVNWGAYEGHPSEPNGLPGDEQWGTALYRPTVHHQVKWADGGHKSLQKSLCEKCHD